MKISIYCEECQHYIMDVERRGDVLEQRKCACGKRYVINIYQTNKIKGLD